MAQPKLNNIAITCRIPAPCAEWWGDLALSLGCSYNGKPRVSELLAAIGGDPVLAATVKAALQAHFKKDDPK